MLWCTKSDEAKSYLAVREFSRRIVCTRCGRRVFVHFSMKHTAKWTTQLGRMITADVR